MNEIDVEVMARTIEAPGIVSIRLRAESASALPAWTPGAHIEVTTPLGPRQYSLCGGTDSGGAAGGARGDWTIAVLDEPQGRGGSRWIHDRVHPGMRLRVSVPRDTFGYRAPERASGPVLLIAGGIGITPLLPMAQDLDARGAEWRLLYSARERGGHAFASRLADLAGASGERAELRTSRSDGRLSVRSELARLPATGTVYCCGPSALITEVHAVAEELGMSDRVHTETFDGNGRGAEPGDAAFSVTLNRSGRDIEVPADMTLLERLGEAGAFVVSSCRSGYCGSCETPVLAGLVDHRDQVLSEAERAVGDCMFPCVSRAVRGEHLVLDL